MSSFETQIRDLRDGSEKRRRRFWKVKSRMWSSRASLIKARDRDVATANRKAEEDN